MRRLLSDAAEQVLAAASTVRAGWNRFLFRPADPTALGLVRIAAGLLAFWSLLVLGLDLEAYLGTAGWQSLSVSRAMSRPFAWSIWWLVGDAWLRPMWLAGLAVSLLCALGLWSRATTVLTWIVMVSTVRRAPSAVFGFDQILSMLLLYLAATGASGQAASLDRFLERLRQARRRAFAQPPRQRPDGQGRDVAPGQPGRPQASVSANLALRLIQLHLALIYGIAGLAKLQGLSWWNGEAVWRMMATGEFVALDFTPLARWPMLTATLTHATLSFELLYPILIWSHTARPFLIAGATLLHTAIAVVNPGLMEFGLAMIAANLAFVPGAYLRSLATGRQQPALRVLFDGACPRCRGWMTLLTAADPDEVLTPIDLTAVDVRRIHPDLSAEACLKRMHVVNAGGRLYAGFDALCAITSWLPLFWLCSWLGRLPGVAWAGRIGYDWYAANRPREVACTDDVCGIHSRPLRDAPRDRGVPKAHTTAIEHETLRRRKGDD